MSTLKKWSRKIKKFFNKPKTREALKEAQREFRDFLRDPGIVASIVRSWIAGRLVDSGVSSDKANAAIAAVWREYVRLIENGDAPTAATEKIAVSRLLGVINDPNTRALFIVFFDNNGFEKSDSVLLTDIILKTTAELAGSLITQ